MRPLRVLITNHRLARRGGTELYLRDVAVALQERGHEVVVYSPQLGEVADALRAATVPVVADPADVGAAPDVIHGQHHVETMAALLAFPGVPALFVCHGWAPWIEAPPRFPRVRRHVAVDAACRDRLVLAHGVPEDRVHVLHNFVDLARFPARGPLPARPRRALVFSAYTARADYVAAVRAACAREGVGLDVVGAGEGTGTDDPGALLAGYDLVFAKGRSALEALAVGAAVVPCDAAGMGPMVTSDNWQALRARNFGIRTLRERVTPEAVGERLRAYDAADAARVSAAVRAAAAHGPVVDALEALYHEVVAEQREADAACADPAAALADELRAAGAYLRALGPRLQERSLLVSLLRRTPVGAAVRAGLALRALLGRDGGALARLDRALADPR